MPDFNTYVKETLVGSGSVSGAAILDSEGATLAEENLNVSPEEGAKLHEQFRDADMAFVEGVTVGGISYNCVRAEMGRRLYSKKRKIGAICVKAGVVIIVGVYTDAMAPGPATAAVERVGDALANYRGGAVPEPPATKPVAPTVTAAPPPPELPKEMVAVAVPTAPVEAPVQQKPPPPRLVSRAEAQKESELYDGMPAASSNEVFNSKETVKVATRCDKCHEPITTSWATAMGKTFHEACLSCSSCSKKLGARFYLLGDDPTCDSCHASVLKCAKCGEGLTDKYVISGNDKFHEKCVEKFTCAACSKVIDGTVLTADGKKWHHDGCFKCGQCGTALGKNGDPYYKKPGSDGSFCGGCAAAASGGASAPGGAEAGGGDSGPLKCSKCAEVIDGDFLRLEGKALHASCITCDACNTSLLGADNVVSYHDEEDGKRVCDKCHTDYQPSLPCGTCSQLITPGELLRWKDKTFHTQCLKCYKCSKVLSASDDIYDHGGQPSCEGCRS